MENVNLGLEFGTWNLELGIWDLDLESGYKSIYSLLPTPAYFKIRKNNFNSFAFSFIPLSIYAWSRS